MEHAGHRERLRERYRTEGLEGFAPHEVLELLLTYAIPRQDTNPIAHRLVDRFGSLHGVLEASPQELEQVDGVGPRASALLSMLLPVLRRYEQEKLLPRPRLNTYVELAPYCRSLFLGKTVEQLYLLCFDAKMNLLAAKRLASGTPSEVQVLPRQVAQEAIRHNAVGAVLAHNHPSGSVDPSDEDVEMTYRVQTALDSVGVRLYDHVIVSGGRDFSMFANRLIAGAPRPSAPPEAEMELAADRPQRQLTWKEKRR